MDTKKNKLKGGKIMDYAKVERIMVVIVIALSAVLYFGK